MVALTYSAFMYYNDPYVLIKPDYFKKILPYSPMYNYNFIRQYEKIDYGFLGSIFSLSQGIPYLFLGAAIAFGMIDLFGIYWILVHLMVVVTIYSSLVTYIFVILKSDKDRIKKCIKTLIFFTLLSFLGIVLKIQFNWGITFAP